MTLQEGQRYSFASDIRKSQILVRRILLEVGNLQDANLLREAQEFSVVTSNLVNAMAIIRNGEVPP